MKRQKAIKRLHTLGIHTAKDIPNAELLRKLADAQRNPEIAAPPYKPLPRIVAHNGR